MCKGQRQEEEWEQLLSLQGGDAGWGLTTRKGPS